MIPAQAVEAAVSALIASKLGDHAGINGEEFVEAAQAALEAAAPHMLAESEAKLAAVERLLDEKYKLWAAICGNTCSNDIIGVDHDAIADEIAAAIRQAMSGTP